MVRATKRATIQADKKNKDIRVRLTDLEFEELNDVCSSLKIEKSSLVRQAIIDYLANKNIKIWE